MSDHDWEADYKRKALEDYRRRMGHDRPLADRAAEARANADKAPRIRRTP